MHIGRDIHNRAFWKTGATHALSAVGFMALFIELYNTFWPNKLPDHRVVTSAIVAISAGTYAFIRSWPRAIDQKYSRPNTRVRIIEGDLFSQDTNLVIGMTDTFDTAVPHVISTNSIQGQFLDRIYSSDTDALDNDLDEALRGLTPIDHINKPGKTSRYPLGTIASIRHNRRFYFCVAYGQMNEKNETLGTVDGVWRSLENLWNEIRSKANGDPVAMPVIGGGQSRMSQILPAQDSIRLIALSFILASRDQRICEHLDIVVPKHLTSAIDMPGIQSFLSSLQSS